MLSLCGIALNLLKPWPFKIIVDDDSARQRQSRFIFAVPAHAFPPRQIIPLLCLALVGLQLLWGIVNLVTNYIFVKIGLQALLKLRTDLYAYLQSLSLKYHDARRSSDSSFRVAYDSQAIQTIYNKGFTNIFGSVITLIGTFVIMVRIDWQLTLALPRHRSPDRGRDLLFRASHPDASRPRSRSRKAPSSPRPRKD